jgi:hypothetical protein
LPGALRGDLVDRDECRDCKSGQRNGEKAGGPAGAGGSIACDHDAGNSESKAVAADGRRKQCRLGFRFYRCCTAVCHRKRQASIAGAAGLRLHWRAAGVKIHQKIGS